MRTTITLDPDAEAIIRRRMREHGLSFKDAVNDAVRGSAAQRTEADRFRTVSLDRALQLAADLEDDELVRRMRSGS